MSERTVVDPEPLSVALAILGGLGSVASLASLALQHKSTARQAREAARATLLDSMENAERAARTLAGCVASFDRLVSIGTRHAHQLDSARLVPRFGSTAVVFDTRGLVSWQRLITKSANANARLQRATSEILAFFASSPYEISSDMSRQISHLQGSLNSMLVGLGDREPVDIVGSLHEAAAEAQYVLSSLRHELRKALE